MELFLPCLVRHAAKLKERCSIVKIIILNFNGQRPFDKKVQLMFGSFIKKMLQTMPQIINEWVEKAPFWMVVLSCSCKRIAKVNANAEMNNEIAQQLSKVLLIKLVA